MRKFSARQFIVLILTILLGMGPMLSGAQAGAHDAGLAIAADMDAPGSSGCDGCGNGDSASQCEICVISCNAGCVLGMLSHTETPPETAISSRFHSESVGVRQRLVRPDPFPPRFRPFA
jgi:hypothetical protein